MKQGIRLVRKEYLKGRLVNSANNLRVISHTVSVHRITGSSDSGISDIFEMFWSQLCIFASHTNQCRDAFHRVPCEGTTSRLVIQMQRNVLVS